MNILLYNVNEIDLVIKKRTKKNSFNLAFPRRVNFQFGNTNFIIGEYLKYNEELKVTKNIFK